MHMSTGGGGSSSGSLNDTGVNFANGTQAFNFLQEILDDSVFQPQSIVYSVYFWYGAVVVAGIASVLNIVRTLILRNRYVLSRRGSPARRMLPLITLAIWLQQIEDCCCKTRKPMQAEEHPSKGVCDLHSHLP